MRRRRGAELESALLEAAWVELVSVGYAGMTMETVSRRAQTGIAVLYRRWANKDDLVLAAFEHYRQAHPVSAADTGTLRGDLVALLTSMSKARATFTAVAAATAFAGLHAGTGSTPARIRDRLLGTHPLALADVIYLRAHERGEIDLSALPRAVRTMPFDLVRHDLLMNVRPLSTARIRSIVDELFAPLAGLALG